MSDKLNNKAWMILFERHNILEKVESNGICYISAADIKKEREPRLMAKFDHTINLPPVFAQNKLSILPITRSSYAIAHFDAYHSFEECKEPITNVAMPSHIQSIDPNNISSEAIALNCAIATGIISDFTKDMDIIPTVSGRMRSGQFDFHIKDTLSKQNLLVSVNNSQIEIDAAYEGINSLALIEAKIDLSEDFLVRQLYYPFRAWHQRVTKPVKPIFLVYTNGIYNLYEYEFCDPNEYSSLKLVKSKRYCIDDTNISISDIQKILDTIGTIPEPEIPFPQADIFERVINLCELISSKNIDSKDKITLEYAFDKRQTDYYLAAAEYLGLIKSRKVSKGDCFSLTEYGNTLLKMNYKQRQLAYVQCILSHSAFKKVLQLYFLNGCMPQDSEIVRIMKQLKLYHVKADSTFIRRRSTIKGWCNWIVSLISEG